MSLNHKLRARIKSVGSTRKIIKAMQLISVAKLKKLKNKILDAELALSHINHVAQYIASDRALVKDLEAEKAFFSIQKDNAVTLPKACLLIAMMSERGLCGGFNGSIIRQVRDDAAQFLADDKHVRLIVIGHKGYELMKRSFASHIVDHFNIVTDEHESLIYELKAYIIQAIYNQEIDSCYIYFNKFKNSITNITTKQQLLPILAMTNDSKTRSNLCYEYDGNENYIYDIISLYIHWQISHALLHSTTCEEGARMVAMSGAVTNASNIIDQLTLRLNRSRQARITNELAEIISGAEAVQL